MPRVQIDVSDKEMKELLFRTKADNIARAIRLVIDSFLEDNNLRIDVSEFNKELRKLAEESLRYAAEQVIKEFKVSKENLQNSYAAKFGDLKKNLEEQLKKIERKYEEIDELIEDFERRLELLDKKAEVFKKAEEIIKAAQDSDNPLVIADKVAELSKFMELINGEIEDIKSSIKDLKKKLSRIPKPCQNDYQFNKFLEELKNSGIVVKSEREEENANSEESGISSDSGHNANNIPNLTESDSSNQANTNDVNRRTIAEIIEKEINPILSKTLGVKLSAINETHYQFISSNPLVVVQPRKELMPIIYELIKAKIGNKADVGLMDTGIRFLISLS